MGRSVREKPQQLADKLKQIRNHLNLSQTEMLIRLGYGADKKDFRSIISAYEIGKREPTLPDLLSYARAAGVTVESLIDDEQQLVFRSPIQSD